MAIIQQLGINGSFAIQLVFFLLAYIFLTEHVFKAYTNALLKREERTKGSEDQAVEFQKKASELKLQFEGKARHINSDVKTIYDTYHDQAWKEYTSIINKAKEESVALVEQTRNKVSSEISEAAKKLKSDIPTISLAISKKLIGK